MELMNSKPKDLAHAIRTFANRTAMLRECGFPHIGDLLVALLTIVPTAAQKDPQELTSPSSHSKHTASAADHDPACITVEQATAIGGMLAERGCSSHLPSTALHFAVESHAILREMNARHAWFVPMLEVFSALPAAAKSRRSSLGRRLSARVTPQNANFDSVVRSIPMLLACFWLVLARRESLLLCRRRRPLQAVL